MNCYSHEGRAAVGVCAGCGKAIGRACVGRDTPQLVCTAGVARTPGRYATGPYGRYEYRSAETISGWPLVHVCVGNDPVTFRPSVAKGIIAIGNAAVGIAAIGGAAFGLFAFGGFSMGLIAAVGGLALGTGLSIGGLSIGGIAFGGPAIGFQYAVGGAAFGRAAIDAVRCDGPTLELARQWLRQMVAACR